MTLFNRLLIAADLTPNSYYGANMSCIISPNIALGFGVILSIYDNEYLIVDIIPCKNRATAEFIFRSYNS